MTLWKRINYYVYLKKKKKKLGTHIIPQSNILSESNVRVRPNGLPRPARV